MWRAALAAVLLLKVHPATAIAQGGRHEYRQLHMGVEVRLVLSGGEPADADAAARSAYATIAELEQIFSDWRPQSEVRRLASHTREWVPVSPPLFEVVAQSLLLARASGGAFDPTIGPIVELWRSARTSGMRPAKSALARARHAVGWRAVGLDSNTRSITLQRTGMRLDFGGIAKGYILDSARAVLRERGFTRVLLEAGGDLVLGDSPEDTDGWEVEVASDDGVQTLSLANVGVGTSGPSAQFVMIGGRRYSHVIDPRHGVPLTTGLQATVIHPVGAMSDALATMVTVLGPVRGPALARRLGARTVLLRGATSR